MSCEHAHTTTLSWMYGEGPEDHDLHVAGCEACSEVLALHSDTLAAVPDGRPLVVPEPANRSMSSLLWLGGIAVTAAVAATVLLALLPHGGAVPETPVVHEDVALRVMDLDGFEGGDIDIDRELDVLLLELETL